MCVVELLRQAISQSCGGGLIDNAQNFEAGDLVDIETVTSGRQMRYEKLTAVEHAIAPGSVAAYYPEANCLIALDNIDPQSGIPAYKSVPVRVKRSSLN